MGIEIRNFFEAADAVYLSMHGVEGRCACGVRGLLDKNHMCFRCKTDWDNGKPLPTQIDYYAHNGKPRSVWE